MNSCGSADGRKGKPNIFRGALTSMRVVTALLAVLIALLAAIFNDSDATHTSEPELRNIVTEFGSNANNPANAAASKISFNAINHERATLKNSQLPDAP